MTKFSKFIISKNFLTRLAFCFAIAMLVCFYVDPFSGQVFADDVKNNMNTDILAQVFCNAVYYITSGVGKAVAVLCVIFLGVGLFFGKTNWGLAFAVCLGIACIFGAAYVMKIILGDDKDGKQGVLDCGKEVNVEIVPDT